MHTQPSDTPHLPSARQFGAWAGLFFLGKGLVWLIAAAGALSLFD